MLRTPQSNPDKINIFINTFYVLDQNKRVANM